MDHEALRRGLHQPHGQGVFHFQGVRDFSEGLAAVQQDGKWGFINPKGEVRIELQLAEAGSFHEGLAAAKHDGKWGYLDSTGAWKIPPQFAKAADFSDHLALTDRGYINPAGKLVIPAEDGTAFVQGLAHVYVGEGDFGYLNHAGKLVFRYHPDPAKWSASPYSSRH